MAIVFCLLKNPLVPFICLALTPLTLCSVSYLKAYLYILLFLLLVVVLK